jgi:pilus assembly protein CpaF
MWQIRKPVRSDADTELEEDRERVLEEHRLVTVGDAGAFEKRDKNTELKVELHQRLIDLINLQALDKMSRQQIEEEIGDIVAEELAKQNQALNQVERKQLLGDVLDELLGLGPLEPLLKDPTITDILVNGHDRVFVERYGVLESSAVRFKDEKHLFRIIQKIVSAVGRRIDESSPMVDARLADGSRVNAVVPPLALDGSLLSIRKFARVPISMDRLVEIGSIPLQVAEVL